MNDLRYDHADDNGIAVRVLTDRDCGVPVALVGAGLAREGVVDATYGTVRPHEAAPLCRAIYAACGLPDPDLPDVPDPAEVSYIARHLRFARTGLVGDGFSEADERHARVLIAHGIRFQPDTKDDE